MGATVSGLVEGATVLRVHRDVYELACHMAVEDGEKLRQAGALLFAPDANTWLDIDTAEGRIGFYFQGRGGESVRTGDCLLAMQRHGDNEGLTLIPSALDLERGRLTYGISQDTTKRLASSIRDGARGTAIARRLGMTSVPLDTSDPLPGIRVCETMTPILLATLALVNSPKIISKNFRDNAKLNRKREARGRYPFHPHHTVRLNVDAKSKVQKNFHTGAGTPKALHHVRAHLRLVKDHYVFVSPHWRGDPQRGILQTTYEADRHNSKWSN
ncbi:anti-CRISPR protein [Citromicrobium phage vB_CbaS-RXM]|nr:anti-CRISPR protein [Citromicrobium phage vB_CbaS-RXM]